MRLFDFFKKNQNAPIQESDPELLNKKTSVQDDLLSSIKQFRNQQSMVREKFLKENDEKLSPAHEKIARAEEFMVESGLDDSLPKVLKHIWHWASWSLKDSFDKYTAFDVSNISGDKNGTKEWSISFDYNSHHFKFIFKEQESYYADETQYADMLLLYDNNKVLQISCTSNIDREYDEWSYLSVSHLMIGDWIQYIIEMQELIELYDLKTSREFGESTIVKQAEHLPD